MTKEKVSTNQEGEVKAAYVPLCDKDPDCCFHEGCPAQMKYYPTTGNKILDHCNCD